MLDNAVTSLRGLLDMFEENPNLAIHLHTQALSNSAMHENKSESGPWPNYPRFKRIPKYWIANYLVALSKGKLTNEVVNMMEEKDHMAVKTIFYWCHQIGDNTEIPQQMQSKEVMSAALSMRAEALGNRLNHILQSPDILNLETGEFREQNLNSYTVVAKNGKVSAVVHISGLVAEVLVQVTGDFEVAHHLDDMRAILRYGVCEMKLHQLFTVGAGPWVTAESKQSKQSLAALSADIEEKRAAAASQGPPTLAVEDKQDTLAIAESARRNAVLDSARKKFQEKRKSQNDRRTVKIAMGAIKDAEQQE